MLDPLKSDSEGPFRYGYVSTNFNHVSHSSDCVINVIR